MLLLLACAALLPRTSRAGSIFDDDWSPPPQRPTNTTTLGPTPSPTPTPPPPSAEQIKPPTTPETIAATPPPAGGGGGDGGGARRPVPPRSDQARSRTLFKQLFAEELKDRSVPARRKFAQKLIDAAAAADANPSDQFVLLTGAVTAAQEAASLRMCVRAGDLLAGGYAVDGLAVKAEAAQTMKLRADTPAATRENVRAALELAGQLTDADDFAAAAQLCATLIAAAAADPSLRAAAQDQARVVDLARAAKERAAPSLARLKAAPDDPAANGAVGIYLCFHRGQWDRGLPLLAKGPDAALRSLAARDVASPAEPQQQFDLAGAWWEDAEKAPDAARKAAVRSRAADWYERARPGLTVGLAQGLADRRIADAPLLPGRRVGRTIDLIQLLDVKRDVVRGNWSRREDGSLTCASGDGMQMRFPYRPPAEYDLILEFTASPGHHGIHQLLARGETPIDWVLAGSRDGGPKKCAFLHLPKALAARASGGSFVLEDGKRYVSRVELRNGELRGYIDDDLKVSFKTDYRGFTPDANLLGDPTRIGVAQWWNTLVIHRAEVIEVTGRGEILTDPPPGGGS